MFVDVPVRPVHHFASRRPTGSTKDLLPSTLLDVKNQNRSTFRKAKLPAQFLFEMSLGWKIFFVCITSLMTVGLLILMFMSMEEQDDLEYIKRRLQTNYIKERSVQDELHPSLPKMSKSKFVHPLKKLLQHPKLLDYCHRPENPVIGMEGFGPPEYELRQVHIVISSGHKIFSDVDQNGLSLQLDCHIKGSQHIYPRLQSFQKAAETFSHRNIGSFQKFNAFSSKSECESQQLLPLGVAQLINLGHYLQKIYIHRWKLEKSNIKPKRLDVKSISKESSFQSVIAFLHGFLPESHFSNVKISKARNNFCDKGSKVTSCVCAKNEEMYDLVQDAVSKGIVHSELGIKLENKIRYSSGIPGQNKMTPKQFQQFLTTYICNTQQVPCYHSKCFNTTPGYIEKVFKLVDMTTRLLSQDEHFKEFSDLFMHPFINLLSYRLKNVQSLFEQMFVYSADESFILYLLTAIKYPIKKAIRPASRVIFELYKNKVPEKNPYYLRVLYNGEDITNFIPLCQNHLKDTVCKLKYFLDYHSIESQHKFFRKNYQKMCNI